MPTEVTLWKRPSTANSKYENSNGITDYNALNFYGNYNNTWGKHEVTVMGGFNQESSDYRYGEMSRMNMINEDLPSISQATGDYFAKDKFERYTVRGLFYRINYSFAGKYLIETNGRYDGSSKFPKDSRWFLSFCLCRMACERRSVYETVDIRIV